MTEKTQNLSLRLIREGLTPELAVQPGVTSFDWPSFPEAKIATGNAGGVPPKWANFLNLSEDVKGTLHQRCAFGLVFLAVSGRWFALSFGHGHAKLNPIAIEQDFGLRVVLNAVDHRNLRSVDLRSPDANTLSRRSQTSRGSERSAFEIDPERDIVRGLLGEPKDKTFATRISGADALTIRRKAAVADLPQICAQALKFYGQTDYQAEFGWIDRIRHVRELETLETLRQKLVDAIDEALTLEPSQVDTLTFAYPIIYDPDKAGWVRFRGYGKSEHYPDLEIAHYLAGLKSKNISKYELAYLDKHSVEGCDEDGKAVGQSWRLEDCLVFETELDDHRYTLSCGRWYRISADLAKEVAAFFDDLDRVELPVAEAGDNEKTYNARLAQTKEDFLCLDTKLVKPSDASSSIEVCDFLSENGWLIHIKDKSESSRLSHLFNQGLISAVTLKRDAGFRDRLRAMIMTQPGGTDYVARIRASTEEFQPAQHTVVFGVLVNCPNGKEPCLPFFSLISLRHAVRRIRNELGFKVAFAWVKKPGVGTAKKTPRAKRAA